MRLPMASEDLGQRLAIITDAVLASSAVVRRIPTRDEQPVQQLGRVLHEALLAGEVRELFGASAQRARQEGRSLRLVLRVHPPELAQLPWEFLYDPGRQDYLGLSLPLVRHPQVLAPQLPCRLPRRCRSSVWSPVLATAMHYRLTTSSSGCVPPSASSSTAGWSG
jgi:hypothetical protein